MDDLLKMYKKVCIYDLFVLITLVAILSIINSSYILPAILGVIVALGNFIISGLTINDAFAKNKVNFFTYLSSALKIFVVCIIGLILIAHNKYYLIPYVCGYISHLISLIVYGLKLKDE